MSARRRLVPRRARGEFVAAVVVGVVGVTLGPGPGSLMAVHLLVERLPQVLIDDRFFGGCKPALALPAVDPGGDAVLDILGVGDHLHFALFLERKSTRLNSSHLGISYAVFCLKKKTTS